MLKKEDRSLFAALLLVAIALIGTWIVPSPSPKMEYRHQECTTDECREALATEAVASYTFWLMIVTGVLALASLGQGYFLIRADKTARISADAAKTAAQAIPKVERAYIFQDGGAQYNMAYEPISAYAEFQLKNHGKTPATLKRVFSSFRYLPRSDPENIPGVLIPFAGEMAVAAGSNLDNRIVVSGLISTEEYDATMRGEGMIAFSACVEYADVFGDLHETAFCDMLAGPAGFCTYPSAILNYRT